MKEGKGDKMPSDLNVQAHSFLVVIMQTSYDWMDTPKRLQLGIVPRTTCEARLPAADGVFMV